MRMLHLFGTAAAAALLAALVYRALFEAQAQATRDVRDSETRPTSRVA